MKNKADSSRNGIKILAVDDDPGMVELLIDELTNEGYYMAGETSPIKAIERLRNEFFNIVVADVEMPQMRGLKMLEEVHSFKPSQLLIFITAFGSIDLAVKACRAGACDFIPKPFKIESLVMAIERALREREMRREIVRLRSNLVDSASSELIARAKSSQRIVKIAERAASIDTNILITGESGVGKGTIAEFIHRKSNRKDRPFIEVDCASLPPTLVESELFGVKRGAYTDAKENRIGLFSKANGGTIFLDEIAEMPLESQSKLLKVTETGKLRQVGSSDEMETDVRVIAATNRPLEDALSKGAFRKDLYFRLNIIRIDIPPLRERPEDVKVLADVFLHRYSEKLNIPIIGISSAAMKWLLSYDWPGNIRELSNLIERAVALTEHDTIMLDDIIVPAQSRTHEDFLTYAALNGLSIDEVVRRYLEKVIDINNGNKATAAKQLGIDRSTLYRRIGTFPSDADK